MRETLVVDSAGWLVGGQGSALAGQAPSPHWLAYVAAWRSAGGRTALVLAGTAPAPELAGSAGLFDEVLAPAPPLSGMEKRRLLEQHFGASGFAYMGGGAADRPVWEGATRVITLDATADLRATAEDACPHVEHLTSHRPRLPAPIAALRPHQWLKNLLVLVPMLAAQRFDAAAVLPSLLAFLCFCAVASGMYLLNDLADLASDRAHPRKRTRPLASGTLSPAAARAMAAGLLGLGAALAALAGPAVLALMAAYAALAGLYSAWLKRLVILDILVLAALYTARLVAGGLASGITLSIWLLAFSGFLFLSLGAVKRQAELVCLAGRGELGAHGRGYRVEDLPIVAMMAIGAGYVSVLVLALYVSAPATHLLYSRPELLWGICAVLLYWITRMVMVTHRGQMHDDPLVHAARDPASLACIGIGAGLALAAALT